MTECARLVDGKRPISELEASQRVATEVVEKARREATSKAKIESIPAHGEWETDLDDRKIVLRRVAPRLIESEEVADLKKVSQTRTLPQAQFDAWFAAAPEFVMLSVSATVYDGAYSKLRVRHENVEYTAWTNVDFRFLGGISGFETDERSYSYFNFVDRVEKKKDTEMSLRAADLGYDYELRWKPSPVAFSSSTPEYVMVSEDLEAVPQEVYRRLDDLFAHYLAHKDELKVRYHNNRLMNAARKHYQKNRPLEPPQDIIINFYPLSERKAAR